MKVKILDRYIITKFLGTFFLTLTLFIIIAIVFDATEMLEDQSQNVRRYKYDNYVV